MTSAAVAEVEGKTPTRTSFPDGTHSSRSLSEIEGVPSPDFSVSQQLETPTTPGLTPATSGTADESDTDFQSAYSTSPRNSYRQSQHLEQGLISTSQSSEYHYSDNHAIVKSQADGDLQDTTSTPITTG